MWVKFIRPLLWVFSERKVGLLSKSEGHYEQIFFHVHVLEIFQLWKLEKKL